MVLKSGWSRLNPFHLATELLRPLFGDEVTPSAITPLANRRRVYALNQMYYDNTVYNRLRDKGAIEYVNETLGDLKADDLTGAFNPVERAVELYANNLFNRRFDALIDSVVNRGITRRERPVNETILDPLSQIAEWSNLDIELTDFGRLTALQGTTGIRVVARVGANYPNDLLEDRRVYIQFEHPSMIAGVVQDDRGNVTQALTEQVRVEGNLDIENVIGADLGVRSYTYRTLLTKSEFRVTRDNQPYDDIAKSQTGTYAQRLPNILQVTPYVLARHRKLGGVWGAWCHFGKEPMINKCNALAAHIDRQIGRHVNVTTVVAAKGEPPKEYDFSGRRLVHIKLTEGATPPAFTQLVSNLSLADAITKLKTNLGELRDALPELHAVDGDFLSGQSGETVAQLRLPASQRILAVRKLQYDSLKRALKIALSWGVLLGVFRVKMLDKTPVLPTRESCDLAFRSGAFDFEFVDTEALPVTEKERLEQEQMQQDLENSRQEGEMRDDASGAPATTGASGAPVPTGEGGELDDTGDSTIA